jgi:glycosyltransferase involved in cell wall biosynthesis
MVGVDAARPRGRLVILAPNRDVLSESYVRIHVERLAAYFDVVAIYGYDLRLIDAEGRLLFPDAARQGAALGFDSLAGLACFSECLAGWLRQVGADALLCELGHVGARALAAAEAAGVPLLAYFRGSDASTEGIVGRYADTYRRMLAGAATMICDSRSLADSLLALGPAALGAVHVCQGGIDPALYRGSEPERAPPIFVAVGRMVEKKAPYLTVLAFAEVARRYPAARLRMVGIGRLLGPVRRLVAALGLADRVDLLGTQPTAFVAFLLRGARAFVQHSVRAENGDSEGTPHAIIEAQISGLPVVATRHAGIPDAVADGETGFLVAEGDAAAMAARMLVLAGDPELAGRMGRAARARAVPRFSLDAHLAALVPLIDAAMARAGR